MLRNALYVFFIAMLPVVELRGAIPVGMGLGLPPLVCYIAATLGNILPAPFAVLFLRKFLEWLSGKSKLVKRLYASKVAGLLRSHEKRAYRSTVLALILFVAVPLPGTGAWTGSLLAALLRLRLRVAVPAIALGVLLAGVAVLAIFYGAAAVFGL